MSKNKNTPAVISNTITNLIAAQASTPQVSSGDFQYLKLSKSGDWVYGADETEVDDGSAFVIDPATYAQGFVAWDDGELIDEKMAVSGQPPVTQADLPVLAAGRWDAQVSFALKGIEGKEEGVQMLYKTSSKGGKAAIAELLSKIIARGQAGETDICPIVVLDKTSYKHKKYGKIFTPILTVDEWVDLPEEGAAPVAKAEPVKQIAEPEPVIEPEPTKTTRRKRRAA